MVSNPAMAQNIFGTSNGLFVVKPQFESETLIG